MFGLSFTHLIILAVIAIVFIGPEQLPEVARTIARLLNEWKRASSDIQTSLTNTLRDDFNPNTPLKPSHPPAPDHHPATPTIENTVVEHQDDKVQPIEKSDDPEKS